MSTKPFILYRHRCTVSGKEYIGYTNWGMERRWLRHVELATAGSKTHFHAAIRKYGKDAWEHEVLCEAIDADHAKALERKFIEQFDTYNNGYNSTYGGDGSAGHKWTVDRTILFKKRFSGEGNPFYGKTHTAEMGEKLRKSLAERRASGRCPRTGKNHTEETKRRISEKKKGRKIYNGLPSPKRRYYVAIHPDGSQELIHGARDFSEKHGINSGNISNCLKGRAHTAGGFRFRHAEPAEIEAGRPLIAPPQNRKGVAHSQLKKTNHERKMVIGKEIATLHRDEGLTYSQIAKKLGISDRSVSRYLQEFEESKHFEVHKKDGKKIGKSDSKQMSFDF